MDIADGHDHGDDDGQDADAQGDELGDARLLPAVQIRVEDGLDVEDPAGSDGIDARRQSGLGSGVNSGQEDARNACRQFIRNIAGKYQILTAGHEQVRVLLIENVEAGADEVKYSGGENGQDAVAESHFVQLLDIRRRREPLYDILTGDVRGKGGQAAADEDDEDTGRNDIRAHPYFILEHEFVACRQRIHDGAESAVDVADHDDQRQGDAKDEDHALDEVGVEDGFQSAGIGINDGDDAHDDDQDIDIDAGQFCQGDGRQVHDDGHAAQLVDDEHGSPQDAEVFAFKALLQIMVGRVDFQTAVDGQEVLDGQRDGDEHAQLGPPEDPRSFIGIARQGQEGNRAEKGGEDGDAGDPPGDSAVALEEFLAFHFLLGEIEAGQQDA